jgi:uncharacterized protein (DUF302 family)
MATSNPSQPGSRGVLYLARPQSGVDLPLKALVSESTSGEVSVTLNTATYIIERHSLPAEFQANLTPVERLVATALQP